MQMTIHFHWWKLAKRKKKLNNINRTPLLKFQTFMRFYLLVYKRVYLERGNDVQVKWVQVYKYNHHTTLVC